MELIFRICLFIAGVINALPALLAFLPDKIGSSYGIEVPNANYELLLRHRAVLFGIVGGLMIYSAFSKKNYAMAAGIGFISMLSFVVLLHVMTGEISAELRKIMMIDVFGMLILLFGCIMIRFRFA